MKKLLTRSLTATTFLVGALALTKASNAAPPLSSPDPATHSVARERGRYLVHQASMCVDCHTPRNERGELIQAKLLCGAPLSFASRAPMPWAAVAPSIAGLPRGFTRADTVHFLMTGERPHGRSAPLPPMPRYRFDEEDAEAIATYLESLSATID